MPLLPPLPAGGITDNTINFGIVQNQSSNNGLPSLPPLSTLPTLSGTIGSTVSNVANAVSNVVNPSNTPSIPKVSNDGFVAKIAYLVLGVVIIAGAIWVYRK